MSKKKRLDQLLVQRELVESREKAQALIRAGAVRVNEQPATKPGHTYPDDASITIAQGARFVGRGGEKLEGALTMFGIDVTGCVAMDIGASTGGFTDCLLQHGARHVYAVDVGKGQLHWNLRQDGRVTVWEGHNARHLDPAWFDPVPDFAVVDVSFISLVKIMPAIKAVLPSGSQTVTLIKPQFEAGPEQVGKGGVVRDPRIHQAVIERIQEFAQEQIGWHCVGVCESPLKGPAGNKEFLAHWSV